MRNLTLLVAALALAGCALHSIRTSEVADSVNIVTARLDVYTATDPTLSAADKAGFLDQTAQLRAACATGETVHVDQLEARTLAACSRHDAYVDADATLDPEDRKFFKLGTAGLRKVVEEARR